jgi:hypothetical protein
MKPKKFGEINIQKAYQILTQSIQEIMIKLTQSIYLDS